MASLPFPTRADQINSEWLTRVLRERGALKGGEVSSFTLEPLSEPGQTADLCRIRLSYAGAGESAAMSAPKSLVAKFPATFGPARQVARQYDSYMNEVRFYQVLARARDLPVPTAYAAEIDPETHDFVLLLEDLAGAREGSLFRSAPDDVETGLIQLAKIHAEFWNDRSLEQHTFVRKANEPTWNAMLKGVATQLVGAARANFSADFSPYALAALETWIGVWDDTVEHRPDPYTLVHVDAHPKQMFFPTEECPRFALFDWQQSNMNWGAWDVSRLLATGLSVEDRRAHEHALVDIYYDALSRGGATGLSKERLWFQIKLGHVWNFYINMIAVLQTDISILAAAAAAEGTEWRPWLIGRVAAAIDDWKLGEALQAFAAEARAARAG
jgi:hypothetical protein